MSLSSDAPKRVLCVCLGNICRSPTAQEVFRQHVALAGLQIEVDSAGTAAYHVGESPDKRSQQFAKSRGYNLSHHTGRHLSQQDFYDYDLILAMDTNNLTALKQLQQSLTASEHTAARIALFSEHDPVFVGQDVPDPYYGDAEDFEQVLDQIESSVMAWVDRWQVACKTCSKDEM